jgi:hypothetical protein
VVELFIIIVDVGVWLIVENWKWNL